MSNSHVYSFQPSSETIDVWDYVEITGTAAEPTFPDNCNPFTDLTLRGIFIDPTGDSTSVFGFCDDCDGNRFQIRFMPQMIGFHEYRLIFTFHDEMIASYRGSFMARENASRFAPVDRDPEHPWHFVHRGTDRHFFYNGTTAYSILGLREDRMLHAIDRLQRHGINRIRFGLSSARVASAREWFEPVEERDDFTFLLNPWVAEQPQSVDAPGFDVRRFNVSFWRKVERLIQACRERRIVASVIFYVDGIRPGVDPFGNENAGCDDEKRFYAYAAARLAAFANVHWDVTNEYRWFRDENWIQQIAPFLRAFDPYKHTMSVHGHTNFQFYGARWCDYACYQSWDEHGGYDFMIENRARQATSGVLVPQVNEEYGYEDHYPQGWGESRVAPARNADNRRRLAWEIYMAGGYQTTGEAAHPLGGWLNGLAPDDRTELLDGNHRILKFFTSFDWWRCDPAPQCINAATSKACCLAEEGKTYAVWLPDGGTVSLSLPNGTYMARWYDPRHDTGFEGESTVIVSNTVTDYASPDRAGDWALLVVQI